jgi:pilus assembly protein CpaE
MSEQSVSIDIFTKDDNNFNSLVRLIKPIGNFVIRKWIHDATADILIYELGTDIEQDFKKLEFLMNARSSLNVFITALDLDKDFLLRAMRLGVKEFITQPFNEEEIKNAFLKLMSRRKQEQVSPRKSGKIINVMGSKGGVGTTTVAVNLAANLAAMGNRAHHHVALVDMNMIFGDIPLFLNLKPEYNWGEITDNINRLDASFLMNILTKHPSLKLHVLPSPTYLNGNQPYSPDMVNRLLGLMKGMFDFVVIDIGQSLTDVSLSIIDRADRIFIVSLLDVACLSNTAKVIKSFSNLGYDFNERFNIIINRFLKQSDISVEEAENLLKRKIFWTIPNDYKTTISAINQGKTLNQIAAKSDIGRSLELLSENLLEKGQKVEKKSWKFW